MQLYDLDCYVMAVSLSQTVTDMESATGLPATHFSDAGDATIYKRTGQRLEAAGVDVGRTAYHVWRFDAPTDDDPFDPDVALGRLTEAVERATPGLARVRDELHALTVYCGGGLFIDEPQLTSVTFPPALLDASATLRVSSVTVTVEPWPPT